MTAIVARGDAARLLLPGETVDLIVTSPPYFGLRSYQDGGEHYDGQIGDEATPTEYLDALIACTAEWMRVLKPGGSIFVNLGDKYSQRVAMRRSSHQDGLFPDRPELAKDWKASRARGEARMPYENIIDPDSGAYVREKSLIGLPWRYAIRCIDELGLILRAEIVWAKPNGLPESVTDRVRRSHEQVFHFVKQPRYYSAVDEVRESYSDRVIERQKYAGRTVTTGSYSEESGRQDGSRQAGVLGFNRDGGNALGKLPGSVWSIPTAPLKVPAHLGIDHFAAYPPELVRRIVLGWSPREVCTACGEGRRPVVRATGNYIPSSGSPELGGEGVRYAAHHTGTRQPIRTATGWSLPKRELVRDGEACACPDTKAPATPGVVLDPFGGTGTTALVASCYGRVGISVDLSADYCRLARWRTTDPGERARVIGMEKPPLQVDGQLGMFEGMGA